jgi:glycosyltransferase involved in cell wall biosynthesis
MIRVSQISSAPFLGGAARAAYRLHQGLSLREDVASSWVDAGPGPFASPSYPIRRKSSKPSIFQRLRRKMIPSVLEMLPSETVTTYSNPIGWGRPSDFTGLPPFDLINLHWVSWFMNWEVLLPWLAERSPIIWTLHDLNPLRGIWHYKPQVTENHHPWASAETFALNLKLRSIEAIAEKRITFVSPSSWISNELASSPFAQYCGSHVIPYGLDVNVYSPRDRSLIRRIFGIPDEAMVVGCIADDLSDPRKGLQQFRASLEYYCHNVPLTLITVGSSCPRFSGVTHFHLGSLSSDELLASFYSACDLFVCPSLQDNLPNTVLESISCGTPVLSYAVGGLPDMVRPSISGLTVSPTGSPSALCQGLMDLVSDPEYLSRLRVTARELAVSSYTLEMQAGRYHDLYSAVLG